MRLEQEVFADLARLCGAPGYAHAIAHLCFRDIVVGFKDELTPKDIERQFSPDRLIKNEISTLVGLLVKVDLDLSLPSQEEIGRYLQDTDALLGELHQVLNASISSHQKPAHEGGVENPFETGSVLREPIFYAAESAYTFQYRELAALRYDADRQWLIANKGFAIDQARDIARAIQDIQEKKLVSTLREMRGRPKETWTILPAFIFSCDEVVKVSGLSKDVTKCVLEAFSLPLEGRNATFEALNSFNVVNALPLIRTEEEHYLLFQTYNFAEALYETPIFWMRDDKAYEPIAAKNRGIFTEKFSEERLATTFGGKNVYSNVRILKGKHDVLGEVDVLVLFGDRAIVLQAKAKKLTIEARKGNDHHLRSDFRSAIQDAYDQGYSCANLLLSGQYSLVDDAGKEISPDCDLKEVYILCIVADHYPALSFQARQFLKFQSNDRIPPPFVADVFTLDVMTEFLPSPLHLLSYIDRRTQYSEKILSSNEIVILSYHLMNNLWVDDEYSLYMLADNVSTDVDIAMSVRREGVPGKSTPPGILTRLTGTPFAEVIAEINDKPHPVALSLGMMLLTLGERTIVELNKGIRKIQAQTKKDHRTHDITLGIKGGSTGLTVHCNEDPASSAGARLQAHCETRKYTQKASTWFGLCIAPLGKLLKFAVALDFPWKLDPKMEMAIKDFDVHPKRTGVVHRKKIGRNDPCPCGSGLKYKKCHLKA